MTDKALHEKQCSRLGGLGKTEMKQLKARMKGLVNAESQHEYDYLKKALLATLESDKDNLLYKTFMKHWDTTTD
ncbi:hypothetical protein PHMEG_0002730 [Phytophthora megakarya]|uniref:Uncharacterized protein n=1 Tax=Phytophthora megakarya TaxID=4795 RepID=A0A225WZU6_9STRA|nr:hypothetical protein PHMEG_0002730 [Phytophthora megakarya]